MNRVSELQKAMRLARQGGGAFSVMPAGMKAGVSGAVQAARQTLTRKGLTQASSTKGEVIVLGERVRVNEEGFDPRRYKDVVSLSEKYFPEEPKDSPILAEAAQLFQKLFGPVVEFDEENPHPPCDAAERKLLEQAIQNRFDSLRLDVIRERNEQGDTASVRQKLDHIQRIVSFLDKLNDPELTCAEYDEYGNVVQAPITIDAADEERFKALLRTFIFLVLQGVYRVPGQDKGIDTNGFLKQLEERTIGPDELEEYLKDFQETGTGVDRVLPSTVADVLYTTQMSPGILNRMVAAELNRLYQDIKQGILSSIDQQLTAAASETEPLVRSRKESILNEMKTTLLEFFNELEVMYPDSKSRIQNLTLFLVEQYKQGLDRAKEAERLQQECEEKGRTAAEELARLQTNLDGVVAEAAGITARLAAAEAAKAAAEAATTGVQAQLEAATANLEAQRTSAAEEAARLQGELEELRTQIAGFDEQKAAIEGARDAAAAAAAASAAALAGIRGQLEAAEAARAAAEEKNRQLEEALAAATAEKAAAEAKVAELTGERDALAAAQADLRAQLASLESGASTSQQDAADKDGKIAALEKQLEALRGENAQVTAEIEAEKGRAAAANEALQAAEAAKAAAEAAAAAAAASATAAGEAQEAAEADAAAKTSVITTLNAVMAAAAARLDEVNAALAAANEAAAAARNETAAAEARAAECAAALQAAEAAVDRAKDLNASELAHLAAQVEQLKKQLEEEQAKVVAADMLTKECEEKVAATEAAKAAAIAAAAAAQAAAVEAKAAAEAEAGQEVEQARQSAMAQYEDVIRNLQAMSAQLERGEMPTYSTNNLSLKTVFDSLQAAISTRLAKASTGSGKGEGKVDINKLYCLFAYYTNVYLHMIFLSKDTQSQGLKAYDALSAIIGPKPGVGVRGDESMLGKITDIADNSAKLYSLLDCLMPYIQGIETFILEPTTKPPGYYEFEFYGSLKKQVESRAQLFSQVIYPVLEANKETLMTIVRPLMLQKISPEMLGMSTSSIKSGPILYINTTKFPGEKPSILYSPNLTSLRDYQTLTYAFKQEGREIKTSIQSNSFDPSRLFELDTKKFLTYDSILALFIVLSQKYIASLSGTIQSYCPIPNAILSPLDAIKQRAAGTIQQAYRGTSGNQIISHSDEFGNRITSVIGPSPELNTTVTFSVDGSSFKYSRAVPFEQTLTNLAQVVKADRDAGRPTDKSVRNFNFIKTVAAGIPPKFDLNAIVNTLDANPVNPTWH